MDIEHYALMVRRCLLWGMQMLVGVLTLGGCVSQEELSRNLSQFDATCTQNIEHQADEQIIAIIYAQTPTLYQIGSGPVFVLWNSKKAYIAKNFDAPLDGLLVYQLSPLLYTKIVDCCELTREKLAGTYNVVNGDCYAGIYLRSAFVQRSFHGIHISRNLERSLTSALMNIDPSVTQLMDVLLRITNDHTGVAIPMEEYQRLKGVCKDMLWWSPKIFTVVGVESPSTSPEPAVTPPSGSDGEGLRPSPPR